MLSQKKSWQESSSLAPFLSLSFQQNKWAAPQNRRDAKYHPQARITGKKVGQKRGAKGDLFSFLATWSQNQESNVSM